MIEKQNLILGNAKEKKKSREIGFYWEFICIFRACAKSVHVLLWHKTKAEPKFFGYHKILYASNYGQSDSSIKYSLP